MINLGTSARRMAVPLPWGPFTVDVTLPVESSVEPTENPVDRLVIAALEVSDLGLATELRSQDILIPSPPLGGKGFKYQNCSLPFPDLFVWEDPSMDHEIFSI